MLIVYLVLLKAHLSANRMRTPNTLVQTMLTYNRLLNDNLTSGPNGNNFKAANSAKL